jgi:molecular chaperone GrpE
MSKHSKESKTKDVTPIVPPSEPSIDDTLLAELAAVKEENLKLKAEVEELNEKYLRKLADEVNFRKRMLREKEDAQKYGVSSLLSDLISILDDFDRGIASAEAAKNYEQVHEGVIMIRKQLSQMLENKYSLRRFESKGTPFDPNRHEAIFAEPGDVEEAVVLEEYLPGYALHDRILRSAKVRVRIPGPKAAPASEQN